MIDKYRSGVQEEIGGIKHFIPNTISNLFDANDSQMELLLSKTSWYLGNLEAVAKYLPHTQLFFSILMFNEALKSN